MANPGMSDKRIFTADYEIHASTKMLYPYIQTASGLAEWFADDVKINNMKKTYAFCWDHEERHAKLVASRTNHFARFEFLNDGKEEEKDPDYFELRLESNEMTQSVYIKVIDYSDFEDEHEIEDLWDGLIDNLRKTVGG
jgi:hypothetical protein